MLELKDVHTYYGHSHILQGVNFPVPEGKSTVLLGRNGAGKTTTIYSIAGLTPIRTGKILFSKDEIQLLSPHQISKKGIGLVPQGRRIFPSLSVKENLVMAARGYKPEDKTKQWDLQSIYQLFPALKERQNNMGNELSGGQQQMLAIGRALMTNPQLLLMDEPSEGLAPIIINQLKEIIVDLKRTGLSILLVEQNLDLARHVADNVLVMNKGKVAWEGMFDELMEDEEILSNYLGI